LIIVFLSENEDNDSNNKKQKIRYISFDESSVKFRDQMINFYHAKILITDIRLFIIGLNS